MLAALEQAHLADQAGEVPIGAVVYHRPTDRIIATGNNRRERDEDPTAHAEILAIREAGRVLQSWRLIDCTLAVTLEPGPMCAGAIVNARIPRLVYGTADPKAGAVRSLYRLCEDARLNHRVEVVEGVRTEACAELLREFFRQQRALGKK
jgi:tRNA(adenine34) deaminase